jgi:hypothetical protein
MPYIWKENLMGSHISNTSNYSSHGSTGMVKHTPKPIMMTHANTINAGNKARTSNHVIVANDCTLKNKVPTTIIMKYACNKLKNKLAILLCQ